MLVVGAGAAGLAAARALGAARVPRIVVEARPRIGGRVDTRVDPVVGVPVERGAEFVHGRPPEIVALAREAGLRLHAVRGRHRLRAGERLAAPSELDRAHALLALGSRDDEPFAALLTRPDVRRRFGEGARKLAARFVEGFYLADPRRASSLALARMERAMEEIGGDRAYRADGGYAVLLAPLAAGLSRERGDLRLSTVVEEIRWRPGAVELRVRGPAGSRLPPIVGARAIVTLPLGVLKAGTVRFTPALVARREALAALESGPVLKAILRFRRAFWERRGGRDLAFLYAPGAPFRVFWTLAPIRAPIVVGWAGGPAASRLAGRPPLVGVRAAVGALAKALSLTPAAVEAELDGATIVDWTADPLARGGYAVFPVGSAAAARRLGEPVAGTLFFAGEATADERDAGTVAGAIRTGERAARDVVESL